MDEDRQEELEKKYCYYRKFNRASGTYGAPDFSLEYLLFRLSTELCEYCGDCNDMYFDRVNRRKAYMADNIIVVCRRCLYLRSWGGDNFGWLPHDVMLEIGEILKKDRKKSNNTTMVEKKPVPGTDL